MAKFPIFVVFLAIFSFNALIAEGLNMKKKIVDDVHLSEPSQEDIWKTKEEEISAVFKKEIANPEKQLGEWVDELDDMKVVSIKGTAKSYLFFRSTDTTPYYFSSVSISYQRHTIYIGIRRKNYLFINQNADNDENSSIINCDNGIFTIPIPDGFRGKVYFMSGERQEPLLVEREEVDLFALMSTYQKYMNMDIEKRMEMEGWKQ